MVVFGWKSCVNSTDIKKKKKKAWLWKISPQNRQTNKNQQPKPKKKTPNKKHSQIANLPQCLFRLQLYKVWKPLAIMGDVMTIWRQIRNVLKQICHNSFSSFCFPASEALAASAAPHTGSLLGTRRLCVFWEQASLIPTLFVCNLYV